MAELLLTGPLVSVIIPVFNAVAYLPATLDTVLAQTYGHLEIVLVDDGSTDHTRELIERDYPDRRIHWLAQGNAGPAAARNYGFRHAQGEYIKFLDADDLINPEMIAQQLECALQDQQAIISAQWGRFYQDDISSFRLNPESCWQTLPPLDWICRSWEKTASMTTPGIFLIPRQLIEKAGPWDEALTLLDDTEYFARTILQSSQVVFSSGSTLYYRSGLSQNVSSIKTEKGFRSAFRAFEKTTEAILAARKDPSTRLLCANIWQQFIYDAYPAQPGLVEAAEARLKKLGRPTLPFAGGLLARVLAPVIGWKMIKRLQVFRNRINNK